MDNKKKGDNHYKVTVSSASHGLSQDPAASAHPTAPDIGHSCLANILPKLFNSYFEAYYLLIKAAYLKGRSSGIIPQSSFLGLGYLKLVQLWSFSNRVKVFWPVFSRYKAKHNDAIRNYSSLLE